MIPVPTGVRVWLATGYTDMRRGFPGLSLQVQEVLRRDPMSGHLFCFRGEKRRPFEGDLARRAGGKPVRASTGTGTLFVAEPGGRGGDDLDGADELSSVRNRLAKSAGNLASDAGRLGFYR